MKRVRGLFLVAWFVLCCCPAAFASNATQQTTDALMAMDMEELMDVEMVSTASRKQPLSKVAGSYTLVTEEDIRRSGATNLPEILRIVPGIQVMRVDTDKWALGTRGFSGTYSSKYLVLVDGRPISTPSMAGILWTSQLLPVEMINHIEVVRGPWTSLWGADSLNGVINIITKSAKQSQGGMSVTTAGTDGLSQMLQKGMELGDDAHVSMYGKTGYDSGRTSRVANPEDKRSENWKYATTGVRADWVNAFTDQLSIQASGTWSSIDERLSSAFIGERGQTKTDYSGFAQFTWDRATGLDAGWQLRTAISSDRTSLSDLVINAHRVEGELVNAMEQMGRHQLTWGIGGMYFWDSVTNGASVHISPDSYQRLDINTYAQDRITLVKDRLFLTLGIKLDSFGDYGVEPQPTARLMYTQEDTEYWAAVSRAARLPDRVSQDSRYIITFDRQRYQVLGGDDLDLEKLMSYEVGIRHRFNQSLSVDLSGYINDYEALAALDFNRQEKTAKVSNFLDGMAYGLDASASWAVDPALTLRVSTSVMAQDFDELPRGQVGSPPIDGNALSSKVQVLWDILPGWQLDTFLFHQYIDDNHIRYNHLSLDARLQWMATEDLRLELLGFDLFSKDWGSTTRDIDPRAEVRLTWTF